MTVLSAMRWLMFQCFVLMILPTDEDMVLKEQPGRRLSVKHLVLLHMSNLLCLHRERSSTPGKVRHSNLLTSGSLTIEAHPIPIIKVSKFATQNLI